MSVDCLKGPANIAQAPKHNPMKELAAKGIRACEFSLSSKVQKNREGLDKP